MQKFRILLLLVLTFGALVIGFQYLKKSYEKIENSPATTLKQQFITELVKPAERYPERYSTARCNDGTPFAFKVEKPTTGTSDTWIIYLQGGAYCDDNSFLCKDRTEDLITTLRGKDGAQSTIIANQGIFNHDPSLNPEFHNANKVYAHYCSSDVWSGSTTEKRPTSGSTDGWYFSGKTNVAALIEVLKSDYGLADTNTQTKLLFTGGSAGCFGVKANAENLVAQLPILAEDGRLMLVADGCFVPTFDHPSYRIGGSQDSLPTALSRAYTFWGSSINTACEKAQQEHGKDPSSCFLGSVLYPYLTSCTAEGLCLPFLIQESSIDHWLVTNHGINPKLSARDPGLALWQQAMQTEFSSLNPAWIFSGGNQSYHTLLLKDEMWSYASPEGVTFGHVLTNFFHQGESQQVIFGSVDQSTN